MSTQAKTYVLVHGAFQAAYAWDYVKPLLQAQGDKVITFDLPSHGFDMTPPAQVTLQSFVDRVVGIINKEPGQVILVGHSMAGMVISAVAEQIPDKIEKLVYIAGYLPKDGESLGALAQTDAESQLAKNLNFAKDYSYADVTRDQIVPVFCADGNAAIQALLLNNAHPEPGAPFQSPVKLTDANFGRVPKYYIHTTEDKAVGYQLQLRMVAANGGVKKVFTLKSSHCPFLSHPEEVTKILLGLK